jgi:hypothetical protein
VIKNVIVVNLMVLFVSFGVNNIALSQTCMDWNVKKLQQLPKWYDTSVNYGQIPQYIYESNGMRFIENILNDSCKVVYRKLKQKRIVYDMDSNVVGWSVDGILFLVSKDTILIDSTPMGFSELSFSRDRNSFVYQSIQISGEDVTRGNIIYYEISEKHREVLYLLSGRTTPAISREGNFILFSDFGDLYCYNLSSSAAERLFNKGGSGMIGSYYCPSQGQYISGIRWSPGSDSAVFLYYPNVYEKTHEIYMISPRED